MANPFEDEDGECPAPVNHEFRYSLWRSFREIPVGRRAAGSKGKRRECLTRIEATWADKRPKSLSDPDGADIAACRNRSQNLRIPIRKPGPKHLIILSLPSIILIKELYSS